MSEFRYNPATGDWVIISPLRGKRPHLFKEEKEEKKSSPETCPFCPENIKSQEFPLAAICQDEKNSFSYSWSEWKKRKKKDFCSDWKILSLPNKYPALSLSDKFSQKRYGPYKISEGMGVHEVIVYRDHFKELNEFSQKETEEVIKVFKERFLALKREKGISYVSLFTNYKREAGASLDHPHSQVIGMPLMDPDLKKSFDGSLSYWQKHKKCVHCQMIEYSLKEKKRIIFENKDFVVLSPYAPLSSYETRIYPKNHQPSFEEISEKEIVSFSEALRKTLKSIKKTLNDPPLNFFIHSSPVTQRKRKFSHYHWHLIILPKLSIFGGFELGVGIQIVVTEPEKAAKELRKGLI